MTAAVLVMITGGCDATNRKTAVADAFLDAMNSHDADRVIALLDAEAIVIDPAAPAELNAGAYRDWLRANWRAWPDRVFTPKRMIEGEGVVAIEWHLQQSHIGGRRVPIDGITVLSLRGERVIGLRNYYNAAVFLPFLKPAK
jgi:ketosteroid isomerase-like protein